MSYDGSGKAAGLAIYADGVRLGVDVVRDALTGSIATDGAADGRPPRARPAVYRADRRPSPLQPRADGARGRGSGHQPPASRDSLGRQRQARRSCKPTTCASTSSPTPRPTRCAPTQRELEALQKQKAELQKPIPTAMVMGELEKPRETFVLARGDYRNQTEKVQPGVPAMLPPLEAWRAAQSTDAGEVAGRSPGIRSPRASPSIASGRCTSATASSRRRKTSACRARPPVHPELLDWLATEFVRTGLGHPRDAAAHRDVGDVSAVVEGDAGAAREGSREPAAGARSAVPPAGGDDSRHRARRQRPPQRRDRRSERAAVPAGGPVGGDGVRRRVLGADLRAEPRQGSCIGAACTRSGSAPLRRRRWRPSTRRTARSARAAAR